jgi:hypothetical protein
VEHLDESDGRGEHAGLTTPSRWPAVALVVALLAIAAIRVATSYSESFNWDEFALFHNVSYSLSSGELHAGGRPGLTTLILMPFVSGCEDEVSVMRRARLLWVAFSLAAIAGLAVLLAQLRPNSPRRWLDALLGVALVAWVPAHLVWSVQVRTDQIAIAGALWGGVALLASRERPLFAAPAGVLFALGTLSSQKAIYVAALMGLLALGDLWRRKELSFTRESLRALLLVSALGMVIVGFYATVPLIFDAKAGSEALSSAVSNLAPERAGPQYRFQMSVFDYYRETIGFRHYVEMLPTLIPHIALLLLLAVASVRQLQQRDVPEDQLVLAWCALALGFAVCIFHAGAFPYFWMTLGLFPAVALVLARESIEEVLAGIARPLRIAGVVGFWLVIALPGAIQMVSLLDDTQRVQRESFAFTHRNFDTEETGFHAETGLFCRPAPRRFPPYFSQNIDRIFGPRAQCTTCAPEFIEEFVAKQVKYVVASYRLNQFPKLVRDFWQTNYIPYLGSVLVAGRRLDPSEDEQSFELVVDGEYLWLPSAPPAKIEIDGVEIATGGRVRLERGPHKASFDSSDAPGVLVLAMQEPPRAPLLPFYKDY